MIGAKLAIVNSVSTVYDTLSYYQIIDLCQKTAAKKDGR